MKIGIVTHYLHYGFGGVLQNFALQRVLESLGHTPITLRVASQRKLSISQTIVKKIKRAIHTILGHNISITVEQDVFISKNVEPFIQRYIKTTAPCSCADEFKAAALNEKCDALIVGSDQIWRANYDYVNECFLDFAQELKVKRIAYAASIAVDNWEYTTEQTNYIKPLAQKFDAISVREASGIDLCKKYLDVDSVLVLDPTLLIDKDVYVETVTDASERKSEGDLFTYILDKTTEKEDIINSIAKQLGLKRYECMPLYKTQYAEVKKHPEDCVYPPITRWLRSFMDAELVITDSFHGTAFSIIFNKPFFVLINIERGEARFTSMLKLFGLENRIINTTADAINVGLKIDWQSVNTLREYWKRKSVEFLKKNLNL